MAKIFSSNRYTYKVYRPLLPRRVQEGRTGTKVQAISNPQKVSSNVAEVAYHCSFETLLLDAIDEVLSSRGTSVKEAFYSYLAKRYGLNKKDIPRKLEEFTTAIEELFGLGAKLLEIQIMKRLYTKVGGTAFPENRKLRFTNYVAAIRSLGSQNARSPLISDL